MRRKVEKLKEGEKEEKWREIYRKSCGEKSEGCREKEEWAAIIQNERKAKEK